MKNNLLAIVALLLFFASCKKDNEQKPLKAQFEASKVEVLAGDAITFSDHSEGQPSTWKWTFEGGSPAESNLSGPSVTYAEPGTYAVTLVITNARESSTETKTAFITVGYRQVEAAFDYSATVIRQNESVTFTDKSTGMPNSWAWEFKSATTTLTSTEKSPVINFTEPGVYTVILKATNPIGSDTAMRTDLINVIDITSVEAAFDSDFTATYAGGKIKFNDRSVGTATAWAWTFDGAATPTSNQQNPEVTYSTPGRYKVTLIASNPSRSSTIEKSAYVLVVPSGSLTAFYPMDGSINDAGPSKLVSVTGGTVVYTLPDRKDAAGRAGVFNGSGGFVVPDNDAMNFGTGDYSVSVWIRTNVTTSSMIWQESGAKGSGDNQTWLRINSTATNRTTFATEDQTGGSTIHLTTAVNGSAANTNDGQWHHIVCTRQGRVTRIYIDGVMMREVTASTDTKITSNDSGFKIGMQEGTSGFNNRYTGQIDDLIIYKKALTQAEVTELFNL
jgi:PKD repeat protein